MASVPPQFEQFIGPAYAKIDEYVKPPRRLIDGTYWNSDWDKFAFDYANTIYQNEYNAYQAELAFKRQKELIAAQNEYNSPSNQLARYMAAGLNPSMIYGQVSPGLQAGVASYQPQRAEGYSSAAIPGETEKLNRTLNVLTSVASVFKAVSNMASDLEGIRNMSLQNDILAARVPAEQFKAQYETNLASLRNSWLNDQQIASDEYGNIVSVGNDPKGLLNVLFPDLYRGAVATSRADYQNWWNKDVAPAYADMMQGKSTTAEQEAAIREYNRQMLESLPPAVRPYFSIGIQILETLFKGKNAFR